MFARFLQMLLSLHLTFLGNTSLWQQLLFLGVPLKCSCPRTYIFLAIHLSGQSLWSINQSLGKALFARLFVKFLTTDVHIIGNTSICPTSPVCARLPGMFLSSDSHIRSIRSFWANAAMFTRLLGVPSVLAFYVPLMNWTCCLGPHLRQIYIVIQR